MFWVSKILRFQNKLKLLLIKNALDWLNVIVETFVMLQSVSISKKCCCFELSLYQIIEKMYHGFQKNNIDNNKKEICCIFFL